MIEVKVRPQFSDTPRVVVHDTEHPNFEATIAVSLMERWGMVAAEPDGEDSAGRSKLRLLTPSELAQRACDTAAQMASEIRARGWFVNAPSWDEMEVEVKQQKEKRDK